MASSAICSLRKGESAPLLMRICAKELIICSAKIAAHTILLFIIIVFWFVFLDDEVVDDEVLALHRILAHIVFQ